MNPAAARIGRLRRTVAALVLFACLWRAAAGAPDAESPLALTAAERAWLAAHPVIRIGVDPDYAPYAFIDAHGRPAGVAAELTALVAGRLGVRLELVGGLTWPQILAAARNRELDVITTAAHRPDREAYLNFTRIYLPTPSVVMTRTETPRLRELGELAGRRVALVQGYSSSAQALERVPGMRELPVAAPLDGLRALSEGRADAYIGALGINTYLASRHGISNLKVNTGFDMANGQRYGVRKDWPELVPLLEKALDSIPAARQNEIFARWISVSIDSITAPAEILDAATRARIAALPELRVGALRARAPFDYIGRDGTHDGLSADVLQRLTENTGLKVRVVSEADMERLLARLAGGELDLVLGVNASAPGAPTQLLSDPYFVSSLGVFVRKGDVFLGEPDDLLDHRVAVRAGGYAEETLRVHPRIALQGYATLADAARAVHAGRADYLVGEVTSSLREIEESGIVALRYAGALHRTPVALSMAVSPRHAELLPLVNTALTTITPAEAAAIRRRWVAPPLAGGLEARVVLRWAAALLLLVGIGYAGFIFWNYRLRHEIARRTRALAAAAQRQRDLFDNANDCIFVIEPGSGRILDANRRASERYGYRHEELLDMRVHDLGLPESGGQASAAMQRVLADGHAVFERAHRHRDGHVIHVEVSSRLVRLDGQAVIESVVRDVSERVEVAARLRESERKLADVLQAVHMGAWEWDVASGAVHWSDNVEQLFGLPAGSFAGTYTAYLQCVHPDDRALVEERIQAALTSDAPYRVEHRIVWPDGSVHWLAGKARVYRTPGGEPTRMAGTVMDVTERKTGDLERERLLHDLERRTAEMEGFVYTISHDLKSPLITISGFARLIEKDLARGHAAQVADSLAEVLKAADGMQKLIEDLLALARTGRIVGEPQEVSVADLLAELKRRCAHHIEQEHGRVRLVGDIPHLYVDPVRFAQVLQNLIDNALTYHRPDVAPEIDIGATRVDGELRLYVRDNGIGIAPAYHERIFGLFQRLNTRAPGTGVGLAIVRRIVDMHGGRVWVESEPGRGSTFWIALPDSAIVNGRSAADGAHGHRGAATRSPEGNHHG